MDFENTVDCGSAANFGTDCACLDVRSWVLNILLRIIDHPNYFFFQTKPIPTQV